MPQETRVVGVDVAKSKVDACIRSAGRLSVPSTPEGRAELVAWLGANNVGRAVMGASGGYERSWAQALRAAGLEVIIVDPKRTRCFAKAAGRLLPAPARQGQGSQGRFGRMHAQVDRHPQHHARAQPDLEPSNPSRRMSQPSSGRWAAHRAARLDAKKTGERTGSRPQPPESGARSASLERNVYIIISACRQYAGADRILHRARGNGGESEPDAQCRNNATMQQFHL
jgi:hypothetical protein